MPTLKTIGVTYSAMSRALKTSEVPVIARTFHDAGLLSETRRRHLWDGTIRRNRPEAELRWLGSEEARQLGFSLQDNCSINVQETHALSPLGAAVRLRKLAAIKALLDMGAPRHPLPSELNFLTLLLRGIPEKAAPTPHILSALQQADVALDVPGHGSPLLTVIQRGYNRFPVQRWLDALEPMKLDWNNVAGDTGNSLLHELARSALTPDVLMHVLGRAPVALEMFDGRNTDGKTPLEVAAENASSISGERRLQTLIACQNRLRAERRCHTTHAQVTITRQRSPRHRA